MLDIGTLSTLTEVLSIMSSELAAKVLVIGGSPDFDILHFSLVDTINRVFQEEYQVFPVEPNHYNFKSGGGVHFLDVRLPLKSYYLTDINIYDNIYVVTSDIDEQPLDRLIQIYEQYNLKQIPIIEITGEESAFTR